MRLFLLFLAVPLIEIALFVQIGGFIGLPWTLAIVILTAFIGTFLVRSQGLAVMSQVRGSFEDLLDPTEPLAHGAMILFSGALLLTPGFCTDAVGFALLIPGVRGSIFRFLKSRITFQKVQYGTHPNAAPTDEAVVDGDYVVIDETQKSKPDGPSGWTRH